MGKTYHRGSNFKKARRDRNFKKSKKFKELQTPNHQGRPNQFQPPPEEPNYDADADTF